MCRRGRCRLRSKGERHGPIAHDRAVHPRGATQDPHPAAEAFDDGFDLDGVAGMDGAPVADTLDAHEEWQALAVLRLGQNQDGANLREGFRLDRRRQHGALTGLVPEVAVVLRDVFDAQDAPVRLELGHAVDEQERIAMGKNAFDRGVVERKL